MYKFPLFILLGLILPSSPLFSQNNELPYALRTEDSRDITMEIDQAVVLGECKSVSLNDSTALIYYKKKKSTNSRFDTYEMLRLDKDLKILYQVQYHVPKQYRVISTQVQGHHVYFLAAYSTTFSRYRLFTLNTEKGTIKGIEGRGNYYVFNSMSILDGYAYLNITRRGPADTYVESIIHNFTDSTIQTLVVHKGKYTTPLFDACTDQQTKQIHYLIRNYEKDSNLLWVYTASGNKIKKQPIHVPENKYLSDAKIRSSRGHVIVYGQYSSDKNMSPVKYLYWKSFTQGVLVAMIAENQAPKVQLLTYYSIKLSAKPSYLGYYTSSGQLGVYSDHKGKTNVRSHLTKTIYTDNLIYLVSEIYQAHPKVRVQVGYIQHTGERYYNQSEPRYAGWTFNKINIIALNYSGEVVWSNASPYDHHLSFKIYDRIEAIAKDNSVFVSFINKGLLSRYEISQEKVNDLFKVNLDGSYPSDKLKFLSDDLTEFEHIAYFWGKYYLGETTVKLKNKELKKRPSKVYILKRVSF